MQDSALIACLFSTWFLDHWFGLGLWSWVQISVAWLCGLGAVDQLDIIYLRQTRVISMLQLAHDVLKGLLIELTWFWNVWLLRFSPSSCRLPQLGLWTIPWLLLHIILLLKMKTISKEKKLTLWRRWTTSSTWAFVWFLTICFWWTIELLFGSFWFIYML